MSKSGGTLTCEVTQESKVTLVSAFRDPVKNIDTKSVIVLAGGALLLSILVFREWKRKERKQKKQGKKSRFENALHQTVALSPSPFHFEKLKNLLHIFSPPKIDINCLDSNGNNALMTAIILGHEQYALLLLSEKDLNLEYTNQKLSAFALSILYCRYFVLSRMLEMEKKYHLLPAGSHDAKSLILWNEIPFKYAKTNKRVNLFRVFFLKNYWSHEDLLTQVSLFKIYSVSSRLAKEVILASVSTGWTVHVKKLTTELREKLCREIDVESLSTLQSLLRIIQETRPIKNYRDKLQDEVFGFVGNWLTSDVEKIMMDKEKMEKSAVCLDDLVETFDSIFKYSSQYDWKDSQDWNDQIQSLKVQSTTLKLLSSIQKKVCLSLKPMYTSLNKILLSLTSLEKEQKLPQNIIHECETFRADFNTLFANIQRDSNVPENLMRDFPSAGIFWHSCGFQDRIPFLEFMTSLVTYFGSPLDENFMGHPLSVLRTVCQKYLMKDEFVTPTSMKQFLIDYDNPPFTLFKDTLQSALDKEAEASTDPTATSIAPSLLEPEHLGRQKMHYANHHWDVPIAEAIPPAKISLTQQKEIRDYGKKLCLQFESIFTWSIGALQVQEKWIDTQPAIYVFCKATLYDERHKIPKSPVPIYFVPSKASLLRKEKKTEKRTIAAIAQENEQHFLEFEKVPSGAAIGYVKPQTPPSTGADVQLGTLGRWMKSDEFITCAHVIGNVHLDQNKITQPASTTKNLPEFAKTQAGYFENFLTGNGTCYGLDVAVAKTLKDGRKSDQILGFKEDYRIMTEKKDLQAMLVGWNMSDEEIEICKSGAVTGFTKSKLRFKQQDVRMDREMLKGTGLRPPAGGLLCASFCVESKNFADEGDSGAICYYFDAKKNAYPIGILSSGVQSNLLSLVFICPYLAIVEWYEQASAEDDLETS